MMLRPTTSAPRSFLVSSRPICRHILSVKAHAKPSAALLFDCDGVIVETEELHRLAYCQSFEHFKVAIGEEPVVWDKAYYSILAQTVGGGKPKMKWHFNKNGWPSSTFTGVPQNEDEQNVRTLRCRKTQFVCPSLISVRLPKSRMVTKREDR